MMTHKDMKTCEECIAEAKALGLPPPPEMKPSPCENCEARNLPIIRPRWGYAVRAYRVAKAFGWSPHGAGWLNEPEWLIEAMMIIHEEISKFERKEVERAMRRLERVRG